MLRSAAGERRFDPDQLRGDGSLTLVDSTLAAGFELHGHGFSVDPIASAAEFAIELGHATVIHVESSGAVGEVQSPDSPLLCAQDDCHSLVALAPVGGFVTLQALLPAKSEYGFTGWGNDCKGLHFTTALALTPDRDEYWCSASFAPGVRTKGGALTFTNDTAIDLPLIGTANVYPSPIAVEAIGGLITHTSVKLHNVGHTYPDDIDVLLQPPMQNKASLMLMSDACGSQDIVGLRLTFEDTAAAPMDDDGLCTSISYRPSNYAGAADTWAVPAPAPPYESVLGTYDGLNPIGFWNLYAVDDNASDAGSIGLGWSITFETGPAQLLIPGSGTSGAASSYPDTQAVSGKAGAMHDVNLHIDGVTHSHVDDLDMLLVSPRAPRCW